MDKNNDAGAITWQTDMIEDMWLLVLSFLHGRSIFAFQLACKTFYDIVEEADSVWKQICEDTFILPSSPWKECYKLGMRWKNIHLVTPSIFSTVEQFSALYIDKDRYLWIVSANGSTTCYDMANKNKKLFSVNSHDVVLKTVSTVLVNVVNKFTSGEFDPAMWRCEMVAKNYMVCYTHGVVSLWRLDENYKKSPKLCVRLKPGFGWIKDVTLNVQEQLLVVSNYHLQALHFYDLKRKRQLTSITLATSAGGVWSRGKRVVASLDGADSVMYTIDRDKKPSEWACNPIKTVPPKSRKMYSDDENKLMYAVGDYDGRSTAVHLWKDDGSLEHLDTISGACHESSLQNGLLALNYSNTYLYRLEKTQDAQKRELKCVSEFQGPRGTASGSLGSNGFVVIAHNSSSDIYENWMYFLTKRDTDNAVRYGFGVAEGGHSIYTLHANGISEHYLVLADWKTVRVFDLSVPVQKSKDVKVIPYVWEPKDHDKKNSPTQYEKQAQVIDCHFHAGKKDTKIIRMYAKLPQMTAPKKNATTTAKKKKRKKVQKQ